MAILLCYCPPPVAKRVVALFQSFGGQYTCNPKYILLKLHEKDPSFKAYFVISEKHSLADPLPDYAKPVRPHSLKYWLLFSRSNIYVTNGIFTVNKASLLSYGSLAQSFFECYKARLKCNKLIVSTLHGSGRLKKVGVYEARRQSAEMRFPNVEVATDFLIAGTRKDALTASTFINGKPFPVSLTGAPRSDILLRKDVDSQALKEKLGLPKDKRIILFAPTFRSSLRSDGERIINVPESGIRQMNELDIPHVLGALHDRFGGEWAFAFRAHHEVAVETKKSRSEMPDVIDGNIGDDMMEYLLCADVLMTDYSSSVADFALTGRPCFLFALDREYYEKEEQGFFCNYDTLPFPFADSCGGLIDNILAFDEDAYKKGVSEYLDELGCIEDGRASERLADCILHYIRTGEKRLETVEGVDRA